jgi:hypothetical protein
MADPSPKQNLIRHLSNFQINDWSPVREGDDVEDSELTLMLDDAQGITATMIARGETALKKARAEIAAVDLDVAQHDANPSACEPPHSGKVRRTLVERSERMRAKHVRAERSLANSVRYLKALQTLRGAAGL